MKSKTSYVCAECGAEYPKWTGKCTNCGSWNSIEEQQVLDEEVSASRKLLIDNTPSVRLGNVSLESTKRTPTDLAEVNLVLGGGIVNNQVILVAGEPGVGKSTLLLQMCVDLQKKGLACLYASGEESASQVGLRASRLFTQKVYEDVTFLAAPSVQKLLSELATMKPDVVIVDSIQTIMDEDLKSLPGSLAQVKACTSALVRAAKTLGFVLIVVGHINKEGAIAGPKVLEHLVDTVLQFEGEQGAEYRLLRVLKNRFGPTGEVGLLAMTETGLADMDLTHNVFGGSGDRMVGAAKTLVLEGNRPLIVEVQALASPTVFPYPKRVSEGVSISRVQLICAVLEKFAGVSLGDKDIYIRTTGGYKLEQVTSDLAIAAAIISSLKDKPISGDSLFAGEVNLGGRVLLSTSLASRLAASSKMGIKEAVVGESRAVTKSTKPSTKIIKSVAELSKLL